MRLVAVVFALVLGALRPAAAGEVEDRAARVGQLEQTLARLGAERRALAGTYDAKAAAIAELKAQPSAWGRDRKLQELLAASQEMAAALDRKDAELRAAAGRLGDEKKGLVAAIDAELAAGAPPDRRALLETRRAALVAETARPIKIPDDRIDPADDPEDLELKAGALAQSETALRAEEKRLAQRVVTFRRQAKLARSRARAGEHDVFGDEDARVPGRPTSSQGKSGGTDLAPTVNGSPGPTTGTPQTPGSTSFEGRGVELAADPSIILADVLASATLDELKRAERSGDPESLARSAERADREVAERAEKLRLRRLEMLRRARELRGEAPPQTP